MTKGDDGISTCSDHFSVDSCGHIGGARRHGCRTQQERVEAGRQRVTARKARRPRRPRSARRALIPEKTPSLRPETRTVKAVRSPSFARISLVVEPFFRQPVDRRWVEHRLRRRAMRHFIVLATGLIVFAASGHSLAGPISPAGLSRGDAAAQSSWCRQRRTKPCNRRPNAPGVTIAYKFDVSCPIKTTVLRRNWQES